MNLAERGELQDAGNEIIRRNSDSTFSSRQTRMDAAAKLKILETIEEIPRVDKNEFVEKLRRHSNSSTKRDEFDENLRRNSNTLTKGDGFDENQRRHSNISTQSAPPSTLDFIHVHQSKREQRSLSTVEQGTSSYFSAKRERKVGAIDTSAFLYLKTDDPFLVVKCYENPADVVEDENNNNNTSNDNEANEKIANGSDSNRKRSVKKTRSASQATLPPMINSIDFPRKLLRQRSNTIIGPSPIFKPETASTADVSDDLAEAFEIVDVREEIFRIKDQFDDLMNVLDQKILAGKDKMEAPIKIQLLSVLAIAIGHFLDGTVLAYPSPAIPSINTTTSFNDEYFPLVRSFHSLGATLACLIAGIAMNNLGRRGATLICTIPAYLIGFILIGASSNIYTIIAGRFLTGIGLGLTLCIPAVYIVEISSSIHRGILGVLPNLFCQLGIFSTYVSGHWLEWNWLAFAIAFICIPFAVGVWMIPESPTYLLQCNRVLEAEDTLRLLDRRSGLEDFYSSKIETLEKVSFLAIFKKKKNLKPFISGMILMGFFQATAYPILIGLTFELFQETSAAITPHLSSIIVGIVIVISAMLSVALAKKCQRKTMLIVSSLGVSVCLFVFGGFYYLKETEWTDGLTWLPLVNFVIFVGFFMNGYGSVSWLVCAEILPPVIRPSAYPFTIAFTWLINFALTSSYYYMIQTMGFFGTFWLYASMSALGAVFIAICLPETRNKSAEKIAAFYE